MKKYIRLAGIGIILLGLALVVTHAGADGPPILTQAESQVVVLNDGGLDVKYRLTFLETEPRSAITSMGRFDPGHQMLDYHIEFEGQEAPIELSAQGDGFYGVDFGFNTQPGVEYTVHVHYQVPDALDSTTIQGDPFRVLEWSPIEWSLEIGEQIVTMILPIELPAEINQPELVTDDIVDQAGILVDDAQVSSFDRWVYFPTPDEASGVNWLSIYISKSDVPPQYHFRPKVYIPEGYFSGPVLPGATPVDGPVEEFLPEDEPETAPARSLLATVLLFGGLGVIAAGGIAFVIVIAIFRRAAPKEAPEEYQAPEIEIETFQKPGLVPHLDAIEAAMYIGDTSKTLTLVIMRLAQRGVVSLLSHKPLQLEATDPAQEMADYEKALADGIAGDGTLPKAVIDRVMKLISSHLQQKMWNADPQATRESYQRKAEQAWETHNELEPARRWAWDQPSTPWIILSQGYDRGYKAPRVRPARVPVGPSPIESVRDAPLVEGADQVAGVRFFQP